MQKLSARYWEEQANLLNKPFPELIAQITDVKGRKEIGNIFSKLAINFSQVQATVVDALVSNLSKKKGGPENSPG